MVEPVHPIDGDAKSVEPRYLTTKEVADLLRVKERKVYDLAAAGEIPHRRITGKLLFPRSELFAWIEGDAALRDRPAVVTGSHDPLLDWAIRESGSELATAFNGSLDGLERFAAGGAALSGLHIPEEAGWNVDTVAARGVSGSVLIAWAARRRGLLLAPPIADQVAEFGDLRGKRVALRQPGAGAASLFDLMRRRAGLPAEAVESTPSYARTEADAAAMVASGEADAALGLEAMARQYQLPFLPLLDEKFDLLVDRRSYFTPPVQLLIAFLGGDALRDKAIAMGGYDLAETGLVRWLAP